jgi:kumamolisin
MARKSIRKIATATTRRPAKPPARASAPLARANAPPAHANPPPASANAPPVHANAPPVHANAPPASANAPPARANAPPARANAPPARANAPPKATATKTANSDGMPILKEKTMTTRVTLTGSKRTLLPNSRPAGPIDPSETASLTIRTRSAGDLAALETRVREQAELPLEKRTYLTHEDLARAHGAKAEDLDLIEHLAHEHDLRVVHRSAAERSIVLKGRLGDLLSLFPADVQVYHHAKGMYRGRQGEIQMPKALDGVVTGVFGYDTRPKHRYAHRGYRASAGPGGASGVPSTEFAKRYNFPQAFEGQTLDGTGQTVAIIELGGGFRGSDLKVYFQEIGVAQPMVTRVVVDRAAHSPTTADSDDGEVMLDIEVAGAIAPKAKFAVYFAPNNGDQGFIDGISAAVHDTERKPSVISISWGGPESTTDTQGIQAFHELFVAAAALGITICVAAGDHGTADEDAADWDGKIHVDHPAVDDLVLGCGGTQIDAKGQDVVWNDGTPFDKSVAGGGGWASGGGISEVFAVPNYQMNAKLPVSLDSGKPGRGVPDIAMSATNYFTRVDREEGASGGTSAVAPLMSALVALLNQAKKKNVGFLNTLLYAHAGALLHDVTVGTNAITGTVEGYTAGPGWDACSGLGTPDGTAILGML